MTTLADFLVSRTGSAQEQLHVVVRIEETLKKKILAQGMYLIKLLVSFKCSMTFFSNRSDIPCIQYIYFNIILHKVVLIYFEVVYEFLKYMTLYEHSEIKYLKLVMVLS